MRRQLLPDNSGEPDADSLSSIVSPELEAELRNKQVRTAREDAILHKIDVSRIANNGSSISYQVPVQKRGDGLFFFHPDGPEHEPKVNTILLGPYDRVFWVNLLIACDGPDMNRIGKTEPPGIPRSFGRLANAKNDLDAFNSYYKPMRIGDPRLIYPYKVGRSAGYFDHTERLDNPTEWQIDSAVDTLRKWITTNSVDPEFKSIQINLMFAGHGYVDDSGVSGIMIADGPLSARKLATKLLEVIPEWKDTSDPSRLDMYLDCCHSGAVARDVAIAVAEFQDIYPEGYTRKSKLGLGKVYCSCLDDETSFEASDLSHGIFSFAFLHEFSRKIPDRASYVPIALRDVGWYTGLKQHPFLVNFTSSPVREHSGTQIMFPSLKLLNERHKVKIVSMAYDQAVRLAIDATVPVKGECVIHPLDIITRTCRLLRTECWKKETEIHNRPSTRRVFSRTQTNNREIIW